MSGRAWHGLEQIGRLFHVPGLRRLAATAFCFQFSLWASVFVASSTLTDLDAPVFAVQMSAVAAFTPMLIGGRPLGRRAARLDRGRVLGALASFGAVTISLAAIAFVLGEPVVLVYAVAAVAGVGALANMTLQRPTMFEAVGPELGPSLMALDALGGAAGGCLGPLVMGAVLGAGGVPAAYLVLALFLASAAVMTTTLRRDHLPVPAAREKPTTSTPEEVGPAALRAILGVTSLFNLFYFPFLALIPVLATRLVDAGWMVGLLGAMPGLGMLVANLIIAVARPVRLGRIYYSGPLLALLALVLVGQITVFGGALVVLFAAGLGAGCFGAMQATMVLLTVSEQQRLDSMGKLSMAIGCLPIGTIGLGALGQALGAPAAVTISGLLGFSALAAWWTRYRVIADLRAPRPLGSCPAVAWGEAR